MAQERGTKEKFGNMLLDLETFVGFERKVNRRGNYNVVARDDIGLDWVLKETPDADEAADYLIDIWRRLDGEEGAKRCKLALLLRETAKAVESGEHDIAKVEEVFQCCLSVFER